MTGSFGSAAHSMWTLDPTIVFLNHGSFGATPRAVQEEQARWRAEMETRPVEFLDRRLPGLLDEAREWVASFVRADPAGLVFVPNPTTATNVVLSSIRLQPGDKCW